MHRFLPLLRSFAACLVLLLFVSAEAATPRTRLSPLPAPVAAQGDPPLNVNEAEPNDSPGSAQDIGGGNAVVQGAAGINDPGAPLGREGDDVEDWYSFTLTSQAAIQIDLTGIL